MLEDLKRRLAREAELCRAVENAAFRFCPAYRVAGYRRKSPCDHCRQEAAYVIMAFFGDVPPGPVDAAEVRPVMEAIVSKP